MTTGGFPEDTQTLSQGGNEKYDNRRHEKGKRGESGLHKLSKSLLRRLVTAWRLGKYLDLPLAGILLPPQFALSKTPKSLGHVPFVLGAALADIQRDDSGGERWPERRGASDRAGHRAIEERYQMAHTRRTKIWLGDKRVGRGLRRLGRGCRCWPYQYELG